MDDDLDRHQAQAPPPHPWYIVCGCTLRDLMGRAAAGEDPELLIVELYANSERRQA